MRNFLLHCLVFLARKTATYNTGNTKNLNLIYL